MKKALCNLPYEANSQTTPAWIFPSYGYPLIYSCCPAAFQLLSRVSSCHLRSDAGVVPPSMSAQLLREAAGECLEAAPGDSEEPVWLAARDIDLVHTVSAEGSCC